jgi:hypothetical protein
LNPEDLDQGLYYIRVAVEMKTAHYVGQPELPSAAWNKYGKFARNVDF